MHRAFFCSGVRSAGGGVSLSGPPSPLCLPVISARSISPLTLQVDRSIIVCDSGGAKTNIRFGIVVLFRVSCCACFMVSFFPPGISSIGPERLSECSVSFFCPKVCTTAVGAQHNRAKSGLWCCLRHTVVVRGWWFILCFFFRR
ncbi:unnamed protein product [Ectocarpus fasciculatus]